MPAAPAFLPLLSYEVNSTSDVLRRSAALRFRREHDVSLMEWRTLALIEHLQPVTLRALTDYSSTDKAQISRIVSGLVERGMVERSAHSSDARSAQLSLSDEGRVKIKGLARAARSRDRAFRSVLDEGEAEQLVAALRKLKARALALIEEEEAWGRAR
ncbi:MarR family winged helix-turn-helix transcriptional regulator [Variovorax sp. KK3]|uniref:MarR family winged helix-turn-helix transcriptional regulator n=1 Tax=Variovorax sp. KK3 TaxID=1855728 RepID=UPI00097BBE89|nr:MarR family transcriptional regulator [Variovorax sp. KK3]